MSHPLFHSRAGRILYRELPEAMRLFDNRDPATGRLGDLEAFLFGFGHLLDRFDATLMQLYADGFLDPAGRPGDEAEIQGWLLPYVAQLFGVELVAPDPASRRRELSASIWVARRRGTQVAVDVAAEMLTGTPVVVVPGMARVLRLPDLRRPPMTQREISGRWHPADAAILQEPLPAPDPATHVTGFAATRPGAHEGLAVGTPDSRRAMRAVAAGIERPEAETRPLTGSGAAGDLAGFVVAHRRGRPCFPQSYEDRSLRTPDIRGPAPHRPRLSCLARPDAVTLFVRPPQGMFTGAEVRLAAPRILAGRPDPDDLPEGVARAGAFHDSTAAVTLSPANADPAGLHVIEGLKFAGTLRVAGGTDVTLRNCAIHRLAGPAAPDALPARISARNCIFDSVALTNLAVPGTVVTMEYCTILGDAVLPVTRASEVIFAGALAVAGDGTPKPGCLRYCLLPPGFIPTHVHLSGSIWGRAQFLRLPCATRGGTTVRDAAPILGEPGYGVLSDCNPPEIAQGAEDGGEMGALHDDWPLARLAAALRKARFYLPAGQHVFGHYDTRLLAPLPAAPG